MQADTDAFRQAMRVFAGSVCVLTVDGAQGRTGCVASSVSSLSVAPPVLMFSLAGHSSTAQALRVGVALGVSLLAPEQQAVAQRFSGFGGMTGAARYAGALWTSLAPGAQVLTDAVVALGCEVEEILPRHGQIVVLARVCTVLQTGSAGMPLLYQEGAYHDLRASSTLMNG